MWGSSIECHHHHRFGLIAWELNCDKDRIYNYPAWFYKLTSHFALTSWFVCFSFLFFFFLKVWDLFLLLLVVFFQVEQIQFLTYHSLLCKVFKNIFSTKFSKFRSSWWIVQSVQFSSVTQSCPTLCELTDCNAPGRPAHHQLLEFIQTHVHWVSDAIEPSHPLLSPSIPALKSFPASGSFQMSQLFAKGGQSIGVLASASVLPMNSQDWFPLEWTSWISLLSKGLSRVFSNTKVQKHQFFSAQRSLQSNSHIHTWLLEKP